MTDLHVVKPEAPESASLPAEPSISSGSKDGSPSPLEFEVLAEPSPGAPLSADATSVNPETESPAPRYAWRKWLRSGWVQLVCLITLAGSLASIYSVSVDDSHVVTVPQIRTQLEVSVEATYNRQKAAAEAIVGDWEARKRQLEAAEAQRNLQRARIHALAEEFQRIATGADADSIAKELSRILKEEGPSAALDYIETQRGDIIARFLADRAANRSKLEPLLASAGLYATEGEAEHARGLYAQVVELAPDWPEALEAHRWFLVNQGDLAVLRGNIDAAGRDFALARRRVDALIALQPEEPLWQHNLVLILDRTGKLNVTRGDLDGAQQDFDSMLAIAKRLADADPSHAGWQRDLSVSLNNVGGIKAKQGDLVGALAAYEESLGIRERLAGTEPSRADWQRDLSVSLDNVGGIKAKQGDLAGALAAYEASLGIAKRLADADPSHAVWQRDLSVSLDNVGGIKAKQGDLAGALAAYEASLGIRERLAGAEPSHAGWQRDLAASHFKLGMLARTRGDQRALTQHWGAGLAIYDTLDRAGRHISPLERRELEAIRMRVDRASEATRGD